jgi:hypothetical protein
LGGTDPAAQLFLLRGTFMAFDISKESGLSEEAKYQILDDWAEDRNKFIEMFRIVSDMLKILSHDLINADMNLHTIKALIDKEG